MMENLTGRIFDRKYQIVRQLGRGGMGAVYEAIHLGTKRTVAVKMIAPRLMKSAEYIERFKREAEAAGRLRHPNVVNVTDFGFSETADGETVAYLVMEYLDGCSLGEILAEEKKLPLHWTVDILEQVCSAVDEAHRQGIIHRDLKPDNIWLEPNERGGYTAKVLDFGLARLEPAAGDFYAEKSPPKLVSEAPPKRVSKARPAHFSAPPTASFTFVPGETLILTPLDEPEKRAKFDEPEKRVNLWENLSSGRKPRALENDTNAIPKPQMTLEMPAAAPSFSDAVTLNDGKNTEEDISQIDTQAIETGSEKHTPEITRVGAILGTPPYMSPEQCAAKPLDKSSDIYSLGIIAYEMLAGKTPFAGESISVITGHLQFPPPPIRRIIAVPRRVKKVIYQALAKEPHERPPTAEIFAGQIRSYSEGIVQIFSRALVICVENFAKLVRFSLLLYLPTILLALFSFPFVALEFAGYISPLVSKIVTTFLETVNIAVTVAAETLIAGAVLWIVVQYIDTPLRSFKVRRALAALAKKWKQFAWIIPVRIVINLLIQSSLVGLPALVVFALSLAESLIFWCVPCIVMMEKVEGLQIIKRGWTLTRRAALTLAAALILNLLVFTVAALTVTSVVYGVAIRSIDAFWPALGDMSLPAFERLMLFPTLAGIKITGVFVLPFFAVVTALLYLKTRYAGGESTKTLLAGFERANIAQSRWQQKIRRRQLEKSGRTSE